MVAVMIVTVACFLSLFEPQAAAAEIYKDGTDKEEVPA